MPHKSDPFRSVDFSYAIRNRSRQETPSIMARMISKFGTTSWLKPNIASLGFALFLAVNATGTWGGVFPFLPMGFQTAELTTNFFLAQSLGLTTSFLLAAASVYFRPELTRRFFMGLSAIPYFFGWACLVAAMYAHGFEMPLAIVGGALLSIGSAGFFVQWQRCFAGTDSEAGTRDLIMGTGLAALLYFSLYAIPRAVTAYLVPTVFLPLFALAAMLKMRAIDLNQPMFEDVPRENPIVYRTAIRDYARSALCVGAIGFCAGIVRSIAIDEPATGTLLNMLSMGASLIAAIVLLFVWRTKNIQLDVVRIYRVAFPFIITAFAAMPFLPRGYEHALASTLYAAYSVAILLTMVQCAQASRDRGINPIFIYGFFAGLVFALHNVGFIAGTFAGNVRGLGIDPLAATTIVAIYLLAMMHFAGHGGLHRAANEMRVPASTIELVAISPMHPAVDAPAAAKASADSLGGKMDTMPDSDAAIDRDNNAKRRETTGEHRDAEGDFRDLLSKRVQVMRNQYRLSAREAEVAELVARGNTVARIAEELVVSENTIRTHMRRLYSKLDIHKKQELLDLLESVKAKDIHEL